MMSTLVKKRGPRPGRVIRNMTYVMNAIRASGSCCNKTDEELASYAGLGKGVVVRTLRSLRESGRIRCSTKKRPICEGRWSNQRLIEVVETIEVSTENQS